MLLVLAALVVACATGRPPARPDRPLERGEASWYGGEFQGRPTASGERFDTHRFTAAHKSLPFGTVVEVHNLDNDRRVRVRINDRGPFVRGRIIDLSYAAARELGLVGPGTARVEIYLVEAAPGPAEGDRESEGGAVYTVQAGAFLDPGRAEQLYRRLVAEHPEATVRSDGTWHRVQLGEFDRRRAAERLRRELARQGFAALVVTLH